MPDYETYLGNGLFASFDGWSIWLRAPREKGDNLVALDPHILAALIAFSGRAHGAVDGDTTGASAAGVDVLVALERMISQIDDPANSRHPLGAFRFGTAANLARRAIEARHARRSS